ncbi:hypothetical protein [Ascidiimonas sp. W6]|uniref:hypothetical protein n=1 Tax=Ascidiimonas meishanensis TaxID=3128903 RepID=UPI0030EDCF48
MASKTIPSNYNGTEVQTTVPKKFYKEYAKTSAKLLKAQGNNSPEVSSLENRMALLNNQLNSYTKNHQERPERHSAEINFGKVNSSGDVKGSKTAKFASRALSVLSVASTAYVVAAMTAVTIATGGAFLLPALAISALSIAGTASTLKDSRDIIKRYDNIKSDIQEEDIEFGYKKANSQELQNENSNTLAQQNNNTNTLQNNTSTTLQTSNTTTPTPQTSTTSRQELQNQLKELNAMVAQLTQQLEKIKVEQPKQTSKDSLIGMTVVTNKDKEKQNTSNRVKITKPKLPKAKSKSRGIA